MGLPGSKADPAELCFAVLVPAHHVVAAAVLLYGDMTLGTFLRQHVAHTQLLLSLRQRSTHKHTHTHTHTHSCPLTHTKGMQASLRRVDSVKGDRSTHTHTHAEGKGASRRRGVQMGLQVG